ncbi:type IV pilus biogenesis protein PilM [Alkalibacterium putridalgicola]|uniref:type IV pilus biogenesis protein PilM n=1 Tax=Alkalibacterium putridalgicola TaxID=426703 RepID=UPI0034CE2413
MLGKKPSLYMQFMEKSIRYIVMDSQNKSLLEKNEIVFDSAIIQEGKVVNKQLLETRLEVLVKEKKWKKAPVSIMLPDDLVTIRNEEIPAQLNRAEVDEYLNLHINESIRLPFEDAKIDYELTNQTEDNQTVFLVAYPSEQISALKEILEKAKLKPVVADISSLSLYRLVNGDESISTESDDHLLLLQWNPTDYSMTVFNDDIPQFNRHTRSQRLADMWRLTETGEYEWKGSEEAQEDIMDEQINMLERFLEFYQYTVMDGERSISHIVLSGYYPDLEHVKAALIDRLTLPIHTLTLPDDIGPTDAALLGLTLKKKAKDVKKKDKAKKAKKVKKAQKFSKFKKKKKKNEEGVNVPENQEEAVVND